MRISVVLPGPPVPKARARVVKGRSYTPANVTAAEDALGWALKLALPRGHQDDGEVCYSVEAHFYMPTFKGIDVDNLLKLVLDAATGIVWKDDVQVVEVHGYVVRQVPDPRTVLVIKEVPSPHPSFSCEQCGKSYRLPVSRQGKSEFCSSACKKESKAHASTK